MCYSKIAGSVIKSRVEVLKSDAGLVGVGGNHEGALLEQRPRELGDQGEGEDYGQGECHHVTGLCYKTHDDRNSQAE